MGSKAGGSLIGATAVALAMAVTGSALAGQEWATAERDCERSRDGDRERVCEVRETSVAAVGRLDVDGGPNGSVEVVGEDRDDVAVVARAWAHAPSAERAREILSDVRIQAGEGRLQAEGPRARRGTNEGWGVSYEVRVPRRTDLDIETTNGGVHLREVSGQIRFATTNGGLRVEDLAGDVRGRTTNGGVKVTLSGDRWEGAGLDVTSTNGGVEIAVPESYSARLETGTTNGSVDLGFPLTVQGRIGRSLETVLGDGGATVRVRTTNGGVRIIRR